jgi:hypothetical protein
MGAGSATSLNVLEDYDQQDQNGQDLYGPKRKNGVHE